MKIKALWTNTHTPYQQLEKRLEIMLKNIGFCIENDIIFNNSPERTSVLFIWINYWEPCWKIIECDIENANIVNNISIFSPRKNTHVVFGKSFNSSALFNWRNYWDITKNNIISNKNICKIFKWINFWDIIEKLIYYDLIYL